MTKSQLQNYILSQLGSPVINVELHPDQIDAAINDATQLFVESHYDGTDLSYIAFTVTLGQNVYQLSDNVFQVTKVLSNQNNVFIFDEPLLLAPNYGNSITPDVTSLNVTNVEALRLIFKTAEKTYNMDVLFEFNSTTKQLILQASPRSAGQYICEVYQSETDLTKYYGNIWLRKYATALAKRTWGNNLGKYTGTNLPGGVSVDYNRILSEAQMEVDKLELQLRDKYEATGSFFIG